MILINDPMIDGTRIEDVFQRDPSVIPLYESIKRELLSRYPDLTVRVDKTQVTFLNNHPMVFIWLPIRKVKRRPEHYLVLSVALKRQVNDPKLLEVVEVMTNRWMHHFLITTIQDFEHGFTDIIDEAYRFSQRN